MYICIYGERTVFLRSLYEERRKGSSWGGLTKYVYIYIYYMSCLGGPPQMGRIIEVPPEEETTKTLKHP